MPRLLAMPLLMTLALAAFARAEEPSALKKLYERVSPSLVAVQYTYDGELGRREITGAGVIVGSEGLVMAPLSLFPIALPDQQMKDFKIIIPEHTVGKLMPSTRPAVEEKELDAVFVGRDERSDVAFLKTKEAQKWPAIEFVEQPVDVGDTIYSVGLLPKEAGYKAYLSQAFVSAVLRGPVPHVLVSPGGLSGVGAVAFNEKGQAIGYVNAQSGQNILLDEKGGTSQAVSTPPRVYIPARDFLPSLKEPPVAGQPLRIPWLGAALAGLKKDVAEHFNLADQAAARITEIVPDSPATKAGLKVGDTVLKVNGEALERGDDPDEIAPILYRKLRRLKPGDKITLTILRQKDQPTQEVVMTLEEQPRQPSTARRYMAEDLGFTARELVFADSYTKRLPASTNGVAIAFVRPGGSAASARLQVGDLVTKMNNQAVKDLEQFQAQYEQFRKDKPQESVVLEVVRERGTEVIRLEPPQ